MKIDRREFIAAGSKVAAAAAVGLGLPGCSRGPMVLKPFKESSLQKGLAVVGGDDPGGMVEAAIEELGGMSALVSTGDVVIVKPNIAWDRTPAQAACTNPDVVAALVKLCVAAQAKVVHVFDFPCVDARSTYRRSGIAEAAEQAGAKVSYVRAKDDPRFVMTTIPGTAFAGPWPFHGALYDADVLINVPVCKHHNLTRATLGMKNLMGLAGGERGEWHTDLTNRLADVSAAVNVDLTVLDAYRVMVANGPTGGSVEDVEDVHKIVAGVDRVAVDAYGAGILGLAPEDVGYIAEGHRRGMGEMDLAQVDVKNITV